MSLPMRNALGKVMKGKNNSAVSRISSCFFFNLHRTRPPTLSTMSPRVSQFHLLSSLGRFVMLQTSTNAEPTCHCEPVLQDTVSRLQNVSVVASGLFSYYMPPKDQWLPSSFCPALWLNVSSSVFASMYDKASSVPGTLSRHDPCLWISCRWLL